MKKLTLISAITLALSVAACSDNNEEKTETTKAVEAPTAQVAKPQVQTPPANSADDPTAPANDAVTSFEDVKWILMSAEGKEIKPVADQPAFLQLDSEKNMAFGDTSCNKFSGGYKIEGNNINFTQFGLTKKFCEGAMETEMQLMTNLPKTKTGKIDGNKLLLIDENGNAVLEFKK